MDSYLSSIDDYIQEHDMHPQPPTQQELFFMQQQQQQSPSSQPSQSQSFDLWGSSFDTFPQPSPSSQPNPSMYMPMGYEQPPSSGPAMTPAFLPPGAPPPHGFPLPGFDIHGNPIKIRKKPGRKPNPASPALRKAQNRAAQRAFRERKERHLKDLENTIKTLREQRNSTAKELKKAKNRLEVYRVENWYMKGVLLTLQFMCMHHNIDLPPHMPYLSEEALVEMAKLHPHAIEAYVNAYTRNNRNLKKPNLAAQMAAMEDTESTQPPSPADDLSSTAGPRDAAASAPSTFAQADAASAETPDAAMMEDDPAPVHQQQYHPSIVDDMTANTNHRSLPSQPPPLIPLPDDNEAPRIKQEHIDVTMEDLPASSPGPSDLASTLSTPPPQHKQPSPFSHEDVSKWTMDDAELDDDDDDDDAQKQIKSMSSMGAIQRIRLQLRVQSTLSRMSSDNLPSDRLQPTLLQLSIPHDPRIDLIPAPQMRDRMIIFRDQMDYDKCFSMLLNGAIYHGGDPTLSQSWELPPSFHSEYWHQGPDRHSPGGPDRRWTPPPPTRFSSDATPDLSYYAQTPSSDAEPTLVKHPLYDKVLGSPPESRHPITSPTLDIMMTMMQSLSNEDKLI
ncbi:hypothetical protein DM01DRAFT_1334583 [Hesseltinella vesiculosa]|uniref:BZIP domain-containing protein n=1 Tax=Hesseltinella vesiculosa TaxID=101127 RepID=A0A1X2GM62_9FUNG|nr:hypothetical protein DM01DRAFT_1334583 [Hesseltinella vesiculosa]